MSMINQSINKIDIKENKLSNGKCEHPKVKFYENRANLFLKSKRYSKAYKMLHKAKAYRKMEYKPIFMIDEAYLLSK